MNLTLEEQRKLTEFLGECWHGECVDRSAPEYMVCFVCNESFVGSNWRLNFTDWRVVGRLVEKFETVSIWKHYDADLYECYIWHEGISAGDEEKRCFSALTRQEAICRAVLAYLAE